MSLADFDGDGVVIRESPAESARFGLAISRLTMQRDAAGTEALVVPSEAAIVIVRHPAGRTDVARRLALLPEHVVIPAGTLNYWEARLERISDPSAPPEFEDVDVTPEIADDAAGVVGTIFTGYSNHYLVNPLLDRDAVAVGYAEWARATILSRENRSVMICEEGAPAGIATAFEVSPEEWEVELAGVVPAHQRSGRYSQLLRAMHARARAAGVRRLVISTQSHNVGVQRAWARAGYEPVDAIETTHLVRRSMLLGTDTIPSLLAD